MTEDGRPMTDSASGLPSSVNRTGPQSPVSRLRSPDLGLNLSLSPLTSRLPNVIICLEMK